MSGRLGYVGQTDQLDDLKYPNRPIKRLQSVLSVYLRQVQKAVQLLEHVVKIQETTLSEDHPDRLASEYDLAGAYQANGQIQKAVQLLEHDSGAN